MPWVWLEGRLEVRWTEMVLLIGSIRAAVGRLDSQRRDWGLQQTKQKSGKCEDLAIHEIGREALVRARAIHVLSV
jgi:hypothetical protein